MTIHVILDIAWDIFSNRITAALLTRLNPKTRVSLGQIFSFFEDQGVYSNWKYKFRDVFETFFETFEWKNLEKLNMQAKRNEFFEQIFQFISWDIEIFWTDDEN